MNKNNPNLQRSSLRSIDLGPTATSQIPKVIQNIAQKNIPVRHNRFGAAKKIPVPLKEEKVEPVLLNSAAVGLLYRERALLFKPNYWHKFTVLNADVANREHVLKCIMNAVVGVDFFPILCNDDPTRIAFLARSCGPAIEQLCRKHLVVPDALGSDLNLEIMLAYQSSSSFDFNIQGCLSNVVLKRYSHITKNLDLSDFHRDPDLVNIVFCPLSQNHVLHLVLETVSTVIRVPVLSINVANNEICSLKEFGNLRNKRPSKMDFSQNLIINVNELQCLRPLELQEIVLDQNPLCERYQEEYSYIQEVRMAVPTITTLDGVLLPPSGLPRSKKNFIIPPRDSVLADQFIEYYFTVFDYVDRKKLEGLYHDKALFSLSATCVPGQSTSSSARLSDYTLQSRNLFKSSDYGKNSQLLHQGPKAIVAALCLLPKTEHDPYSFKVDLIRCDPASVMISVSGVFRESAKIVRPPCRSFRRIFVLLKTSPVTFQIVNETLHVKNLTTKEVEMAFSEPTSPNNKRKKIINSVKNDSDKDQITKFMSQLTKMNNKWARKCLEETHWNMKEALIVFTELHKDDKIPEEAFMAI